MKVKLSMVTFSYKENEAKKTITCIIKGRSSIGTDTRYITAVGMARCDSKDIYDVEKGRKLARARAELEVYLQHDRNIQDNLKILNQIKDAFVSNHEKTKGYISHQKEYIRSF